MQYRKKPVVVDATQFLPDLGIFPEGVTFKKGKFYVQTLEGVHIATPGDFIVTGVKGEKYPVKPDIFQETYEKVEGSDGQ